MKQYIIKILSHISVVIFVVSILTSCEKMFEFTPEETLTPGQYYRDDKDANAAVIGIYGQLYNVAAKYIIWNELRADLLDVTSNSDYFLQQINNHNEDSTNPYVNPYPFYMVILNCNDALFNFEKMYRENRLSDKDYIRRYSDVASIRSWLYLQLAIHFGNIPYVTNPLVKYEDVLKTENFPLLSLDQVVDSLVSFMENKVGMAGINSTYDLFNTDYRNHDKAFAFYPGKFKEAPEFMYINKRVLMGELYLWQNNYDKAASMYKPVMDAEGNYDKHKITFNSFTGGALQWSLMFKNQNSQSLSNEWIWMMYFDEKYQPNNLVDLFANFGPNQYLLRPSELAMTKWSTMPDSVDSSDPRAQGSSWQYINGQPVVLKYLYDYLGISTDLGKNYLNNITISKKSGTNTYSTTISGIVNVDPLSKGGRWFLYRTATLHLHYAEAANRSGRPKIAWGLMNNGLGTYMDAFPYDFDAKYGTGLTSGLYYRNVGIRRRANMLNRVIPANVSTTEDSIKTIEKFLLDESAYELAYEGMRWGELIRVARRNNDPSIVADAVYEKLSKAGNPEAAAVRSKLMDPQNWYMPFPSK